MRRTSAFRDSAGGSLDRDAKNDEAEIAIDDPLARSCQQLGAEREALDVLIEDRAIIGAGVHAGVMREQHAYRNGGEFAVLPFRKNSPQRLVERKRAVGYQPQSERRNEKLGKRCKVKARIAIDRLG